MPQQKETTDGNLNELLSCNRDTEYSFDMTFGNRHGKACILNGEGFTVIDARFTTAKGPAVWSHENDRSFVEMNFVLDGRLDQSQSGLLEKQPYTKGYHNCLFNPDSLEENSLLCGQGFHMISVQFEPTAMQRLLLNYAPDLEVIAHKLEDHKPFLRQAPVLDLPVAIDLLLRNLWQSPGPKGLKRMYFEAVVLQLLCYQCEILLPFERSAKPAAITLSERDKLFYARDLLLVRLNDPPSLANLARDCQSNEFSLKKGFKALFGQTVFNFVLQERMKKACFALHSGEKTISEIAYELGYTHPQHFHRVFKKSFGLTPTEMKRSAFHTIQQSLKTFIWMVFPFTEFAGDLFCLAI
ncbi:hypothetical protein GCM10023149_16390 [Mucilaginibacter gynuensis]|uniref:HTH araC/xylS-type domain-containing protein n=1 Tax=Mucilaginibacter gynuensis TaxID=1302236 RepID=A0ABP8G6A2_9SPHI